MVLTKEELWERIRTKSVWLFPANTPIFVAGEEHMNPAVLGINTLSDRFMRYIVMLLFQGDAAVAHSANITKLEADLATFTMKFSDVQIQAAQMPQIPHGSYHVDDPFLSIEGNTGLYGQVNGNSLNLTVVYWDDDV